MFYSLIFIYSYITCGLKDLQKPNINQIIKNKQNNNFNINNKFKNIF